MGDKGTNENQDIDLDALLKNINGLIELANGETIELDEEHNPTEVGQADYEKLYEYAIKLNVYQKIKLLLELRDEY